MTCGQETEQALIHILTAPETTWGLAGYCKTLNVSMPFISQILRAKQNCKLKYANINCRPKYDKITTAFQIVWF